MAINVVPNWMEKLEDEDVNFIKKLILASGSLKELAKQYHVTYPTIRNRLDKLIQKIQLENIDEQDSYVLLIKNMAIKEKMDLDTAKILIQEYRKSKKGANNL